MKLRKPPLRRLLQVSCVLALLALVLIAWALVDPHPVPLMVAMSAGQVIGTLSFAGFLWVVVSDVWRTKQPLIPKDEPPMSLRSMPPSGDSTPSLPPSAP